MPETDMKHIKILVSTCVNETKKNEVNGVDVFRMSCRHIVWQK